MLSITSHARMPDLSITVSAAAALAALYYFVLAHQASTFSSCTHLDAVSHKIYSIVQGEIPVR